MLIGVGTAAITLALLIFALRPDFPSVLTASVMQGMAGSLLGPAVTAVSLGLVGHDALAERLGRNQRFASIGSLTTAAVLGAAGYLLTTQAIFLVAATLWLPLLVALVRIRSADIHFGRSCGAPDHHAKDPPRISRAALLKDRRLVTFAACLFLFPTRQCISAAANRANAGASPQPCFRAHHVGHDRGSPDHRRPVGTVGRPYRCERGAPPSADHRSRRGAHSRRAFSVDAGPARSSSPFSCSTG